MKTRGLVFWGVMALCVGTGVAWAVDDSDTFYGVGAGNGIVVMGGSGLYDTFIGNEAGYANTSGYANTFLGYRAGYSNIIGKWNTFLGQSAGYSNIGNNNTFVGEVAGYANTTGNNNTFLGRSAGNANTTGNDNTFLGESAGYANTTGNDNTFLGYLAGHKNISGGGNTFLGQSAGDSNTIGSFNTYLGQSAGYSNSGDSNTFLGAMAGYLSNTGSYNTFVGDTAGTSNTTGWYNTFVGQQAGRENITGNTNTFLGYDAGFPNTTGSGNVFVGSFAGYGELSSNKLYINNDLGTPLIYGEFDNRIVSIDGSMGVNVPGPLYDFDLSSKGTAKSEMHFSVAGTDVGGWITSVSENNFFLSSGAMYDQVAGGWIQKSTDGKSVYAGSGGAGYTVFVQSGAAPGAVITSVPRFRIDYSGNVGIGTTSPTFPLHMASGAHVTAGGVWTDASSREVKENIRELTTEEAMVALEGLTPVAFNYKADTEEKHVGFIAEDVPDLVASTDRKGLSPMDIVAVLTKTVQEQQKVIQEQQKVMTDLAEKVRRLESKEQASDGLGKTVALTFNTR